MRIKSRILEVEQKLEMRERPNYVPEDNTMHHLDNDLHTENLTVVIWHIPHTINCKRIFSSLLNGHTEIACNFSIF